MKKIESLKNKFDFNNVPNKDILEFARLNYTKFYYLKFKNFMETNFGDKIEKQKFKERWNSSNSKILDLHNDYFKIRCTLAKPMPYFEYSQDSFGNVCVK